MAHQPKAPTAEAPYCAQLHSVGNPDFNQKDPISEPVKVYADSIENMLQVAGEYRDFWNLGCGNWPRIFVTKAGQKIGWISYNGKLVAA